MADKTQNVKTRLSFDGEAEYKAACKEINSTLKVLNSEMKLVTAEYKDNASSVDALKAKQAVLQKTYDEQAKKVKETEAALEKCRKATGDNSEESKKLETQLNYQKAALVKTEQELGKTTDEMEKAEKAADEMGKEIKDSGEQADDAKGKFSGFTSVLSGMGTALKAAAAATAAAVAGAATAIGALTTKAIEGYAAQEQLVGGVETLFKTSSDTVVGYANDAYKTAGMSANEYMETVTSFSASLLASMNNDTAAAAEKANVAITDMSDNANKMGTDISLIQNAYNGFAKQNYTMLDNLKLGYGGTKEEMQRLLDDASKLSGIKYDISSYSDVVDAIHVVQTEMGITGTTAKEASTTIEGSVSSMSSAWDNWVAGMADSEANFSQLTSNLVDSIVTVVGNIAPRVIETVPRLVSGLGEIVEQLATYIPQVIQELLPPLMSGVQDLLNTLVAIKRKAGFMNMTITEFIEAAAHNKIIQLVVLAIVCDTVFGVLRAIKEKKFNSCAGIDGAIRKVGMLISLVFMLAIDVLIKINLIGFIPEQARTYLGLDTVGVTEFFALLYIAYEVVSIFKNMALCGLPVKKVWEKVREFLAKYTDELPDTDELDGDSTTGGVEEHRTQER